jgi:hypothetical protein
MLTTTVAGRIVNFSHIVGRKQFTGKVFTTPKAISSAEAGCPLYYSSHQRALDGTRRSYPSWCIRPARLPHHEAIRPCRSKAPNLYRLRRVSNSTTLSSMALA